MTTFVLPLADPNAALERVGGKGMSLAKMSRAGLPVPDGFYLTTDAYRCFVEENGLQPRILAALEGLDFTAPAALEAASLQIEQLFMGGMIPPEITVQASAAYAALGEGLPVAVRSSATAEDLPGASFAGQQETYLNIRGGESVLAAVKKCWASLWTARAIAYRARQGIAPDSVALAVVVQALVCADAAGVMFTIDPVSGRQNEMMITATWGLGEAIVGGLVTPDTLIVEKSTGKLIRRETGEKTVMTVRTDQGTGEQPVPRHLQKAAVLSDAQVLELAKLGQEIEGLYGAPMDIEWALANGRFTILQARPVTTLPVEAAEESFADVEKPENLLFWKASHPKALLARGSFAEFVPDPVTPLFATLAIPIAREETQKLMAMVIQSPDDGGAYVFDLVNDYVYVGMQMSLRLVLRTLFVSIGQSTRLLKSGKARWVVIRAKARETAAKWQAVIDTPGMLHALPAPDLLASAREIFGITAEYYTVGQSGVIGAGPFAEITFSRFYNSLVKGKTGPAYSTFLVGFETISMRAEKSLFDLAMWAKEQPELRAALLRDPAEKVVDALRAQPVPSPYGGLFAERFAAHLAAFGHILYDLDFAKPVAADEPTPLVETLKVYIEGKGIHPYERQRGQVQKREQAEREILARLDPLRRKYFIKMLHFAQDCAPDREDCIADLGLGYPQLRRLLGELGRRLAEAGAIAQAEDVYWLEAQEASDLADRLASGQSLPSFCEPVERRKAQWQQYRSVTPPASLPEKSFLGKMLVHDNPAGDTLKGYAASAGKITARACVLQGPEDFGKMQPGDVIVAVTTTPAWTPLFAMASAVVTDIGGPLSHSSIVAREYGIPAVMATGVASKRIQHGQVITVDGTAGMVTLG